MTTPPGSELDDVGPDENVDLEGGELLPPNPNVELGLTIPLTPDQSRALEGIARDRGITMIAAVQRLIEEGLEHRARLGKGSAALR
jgi:hypothetical protein